MVVVAAAAATVASAGQVSYCPDGTRSACRSASNDPARAVPSVSSTGQSPDSTEPPVPSIRLRFCALAPWWTVFAV